MAFVNGIWVDDNPTTNNVQGKILVSRNNISLSPNSARELPNTYRIVFNYAIYGQGIDPQSPNFWRMVDKKSLENALIDSIRPQDRKYFKLHSYTGNMVRFDFNWEIWMSDAIKGVRPSRTRVGFRREFKLRQQLPLILSSLAGRDYIGKFIARKSKQYLDKSKFNNFFVDLLPREYQRKVRQTLANMMDYEYDFRTNSLFITLKSVYVLGILYSLNKVSNNVGPNHTVFGQGGDDSFINKVRGKSNKFDQNKFNNFINKNRNRFL